jgi:hypothetical protein
MNIKKIFFVLGLSVSSVIHSMETKYETWESETDLEHVETYIGAHVRTPGYQFQEALRKNDLGIKKSVEQARGSKDAEKFFINGWGQVIGALIALNKHNISSDFSAVVDQNIDAAVEKGNRKPNPFVTVNVREQSKNIMMYPHQGKYFPWKKVDITEPIPLLNNLLERYPARFSLCEGKCYLQIGQEGKDTIFTELWAHDFATMLQSQHYRGLQANQEHPHITLINSNVIEALKDKFSEKYASEGEAKFNFFMDSWVHEANNEFGEETNPLEFTHFDSSYSEDYSPFEEVVVARLQAPSVTRILKTLADKAQEEVGYTLAVKGDDSFHLTVATKYREPNDFSSTTIEQIISSCPKESDDLLRFLEDFKAII